MELVALCDAFDGRDLGALCFDTEHAARVHNSTVNQDTAGSAVAVVATLFSTGQPKPIAEHFEKALSFQLKIYDKDHSEVASSYYNIGKAYGEKEEYDKAIEYFEKALDVSLKALGSEHRDVAQTYHGLGVAYEGLKKRNEALEYLRKSVAILRETLGPKHADTKEVQAAIDELVSE